MVKSYWLPIIPYLIGLQNTKHRKPCFCLHVFTINKTSGLPGSRNASLSFVLYVIYSLKSLGTWISNGFKPHFPVKGDHWVDRKGAEAASGFAARRQLWMVSENAGNMWKWWGKAGKPGKADHCFDRNAIYLLGDQKEFHSHTRIYIYTYVNAPIQLYSSGVSMALRLVQQAQLTRSILKGHLIHSWHDKDMKIE